MYRPAASTAGGYVGERKSTAPHESHVEHLNTIGSLEGLRQHPSSALDNHLAQLPQSGASTTIAL